MNPLTDAISREPRLPRFLCHLYQRLGQARLNLVTGAGISMNAGVPGWHGLLDALASVQETLKHDLDQHRSSGLNPEYLGQILYHRFRDRHEIYDAPGAEHYKAATLEHGWGEAIHHAIYANVVSDIRAIVDRHPYLAALRNLCRNIPLVINFNFDDILADAIGEHIKSGAPGNAVGVTWHPPLTDRPGLTTIYHVNGILPRVSLRKRSPQLIFTEDSFADARARAPGVSAEFIFLRFVQNTMLIIGHSLSDTSLKHYLRLNRDKSPANHHYMIFWISEGKSMPASRMLDIFNANIELYNLITIFLTSDEIHHVLNLLSYQPREFAEALEEVGVDGRARFHYYIVGPVASGKSTLLEHLRCFNTFEEWTRPPPREMYLASSKINDTERAAIDRYIYSELKEKNSRMLVADVGIHFMDRAPLDLYAFSNSEQENERKTTDLREYVTRDKLLQKGEIIFIEASSETLVRRNLARGRPPQEAGTEEYFQNQTNKLKEVYNPSFVISTDKHDANDVARTVARHVLLGRYCPIDLEAIIERYSIKASNPPGRTVEPN